MRYTYPALLGRSIKEYDYHGVEASLLEEALEKVPSERWKLFCNRRAIVGTVGIDDFVVLIDKF